MSKLRWVCSFLSPLHTYTYLQPRSICRTTPIDVSRRALDADATLLMTLNGALDVTKVAHARRSTPGYSCISLKCGFRMWKRLQEFSYDRSTMWRNPISLDRFFLHLRETNNVSWFSGWTIFRWKNWKRKRYSQNPFNSRDINN